MNVFVANIDRYCVVLTNIMCSEKFFPFLLGFPIKIVSNELHVHKFDK